jgi:RsiW-degrading membrane proteinase PrsW (M82 family)
MGAGSLFVLGFAPGLFWLWRIYRKNRNRPDHKGLVLRTFFFGVAVAVPVVLVEQAVAGPSERPVSGVGMEAGAAAFTAFVVAGLVEEVGKFTVVRATMYRSSYFDEPLRGIIYSSAAALGFASIENVGYMVEYGAGVIILRAVLSTLGHVFFSAAWGYGLGAARRREDTRVGGSSAILGGGLVGAIVMHGAYDYPLMRGAEDGWLPAVGVFLAGGGIFALLLRRGAHVSPHRGRVANPTVICPGCGAKRHVPTRFCNSCGRRLDETQLAQACGICGQPLGREAQFCAGCGARAERAFSWEAA